MSTATETQVKEEIQVTEPKLYRVIFHNDDTTSFEFVIAALVQIFHKNEVDAIMITTAIHEEGSGVAGIYDKETAETKSAETMRAARAAGFTLNVTYEED